MKGIIKDDDMPENRKVKFAADYPDCEMCGEAFCEDCNTHYWECSCPGPHQDDEYDYLMEDGVLYAVEKEDARPKE